MADDTNKSTQSSLDNFATNVPERPLNPTQNAADIIGDPTGLTGVTQGTSQQTSAEPDDVIQADSTVGSVSITQGTQQNPTGIPMEAVSDKMYIVHTLQGLSSTERTILEDNASEKDNTVSETDPGVHVDSLTNSGIPRDSDEADDFSSPLSSPSVQGEQSVSGDMPDPMSDDDTLQNAHNMGMQMNETTENPQEIDIARDIDEGEQAAQK